MKYGLTVSLAYTAHYFLLVPFTKLNLISNIGFDEAATHTRRFDPRVSDKALAIAEAVIKDPLVMVPDYYADLYSFNKLFMTYQSDIVSRVKRKIRALAK